MIVITSRIKGFRRCGVAHGTAPVEYADTTFTREQLEELRGEPLLEVVSSPPPVDPEPFEVRSMQEMAFICAVGCLDQDRDNRADWTSGGVPQLRELSAIMGEPISSTLRGDLLRMSEKNSVH